MRWPRARAGRPFPARSKRHCSPRHNVKELQTFSRTISHNLDAGTVMLAAAFHGRLGTEGRVGTMFHSTLLRSTLRLAAAPAVVVVIAAATIAAPCAALAQGSFLNDIFGGSERVSPEQDQSTPRQAGPQNRVAQGPAGELTTRLDRLEAQIRQLTGAIEQLQYRNQQLEAHLRRMQGQGPARPSSAQPQGQPQVSRKSSRSRPRRRPQVGAAGKFSIPRRIRMRPVGRAYWARFRRTRPATWCKQAQTSKTARSARPAVAARGRRSICPR